MVDTVRVGIWLIWSFYISPNFTWFRLYNNKAKNGPKNAQKLSFWPQKCFNLYEIAYKYVIWWYLFISKKNKILNFFVSYIFTVWLLSYYENGLNKPKMPKNNPVTALFERMVDGRMLKFGMPLPKTHF